MGYNKLIKYANTVEIYTYERPLPIRPRQTRKLSRKVTLPRVVTDRSDPLQQRELEGKRKDNARRAAVVFRRLISANLGGDTNPLLFTLTYRENQETLKQGYKDFGSFIQAMRYKFGKQFRYISVPEFQKRGAVHFHALFWGLPDTVYKSERHTRLVASLWRQGYVFMKETDGNERLSTYLAKYMVKAFTDSRMIGQKAYVCSRNLIRPQVISDISNHGLGIAMEETGAINPSIDKTYNTLRLGKGRHRVYKIDK